MLRCVFLLCNMFFSGIVFGSIWNLHEDIMVSTPSGQVRAGDLLVQEHNLIIQARSNDDPNELGFTAEVQVEHVYEQTFCSKKFIVFEIADFDQIKVNGRWVKEQLVEEGNSQAQRLREFSVRMGRGSKIARFIMPFVMMAAMVPGADAGPGVAALCSLSICPAVTAFGCGPIGKSLISGAISGLTAGTGFVLSSTAALALCGSGAITTGCNAVCAAIITISPTP